MAEPSPGDKIPLTIYLSPDLARRLKAVADAQKRPAAEWVVDLLDRQLPRTPPPKSSIPYA